MASAKPKGLGRGLEALLGPKVSEASPAAASDAPSTLPLTALVPGQYQPRTRMDEGALYELAESIKAQGASWARGRRRGSTKSLPGNAVFALPPWRD